MEFAIHQKQFEKSIRQKLEKSDTVFLIDVPNDNETTDAVER